jgi:hypothetical protein
MAQNLVRDAETELYGGFNLGALFKGDFAALAAPLMEILYNSKKDLIATGADRIMTIPVSAVNALCDRLGITDSEGRRQVLEAFSVWGDKGGDVLVAIAEAKAAS